MASITQTIPNFLGGVSNQPDDKKLPGQVKEALNAYPDPTFGLQKRPGLKFLKELTDGSSAFDNNDLDTAKWFFYNRDSDEKYIGCVVGASSSPYGEIHIWNTTDLVKCTVNYHSAARAYLDAVNASDYDVLTIRDTSIITNKTKTITTVAGDSFTAGTTGTVKMQLVEYSQKYTVTVNGTDYVVSNKAGDTPSGDADTTTFLNAKDILTALKNLIDAASISNLNTLVIGSTLELWSTGAAFTLSAFGGRSGDALTSYQDEVDSTSDLATASKHDRIVTVKNTSNTNDTYYAKFIADETSGSAPYFGSGHWEETLKPGETKGVTESTMPHHLYSTAKNVFSFSAINGLEHGGGAGAAGSLASRKWEERKVGDDTTNEDPSFVGTTIQQAFFYNNRLGFLTEDNVSMSKSGKHYDFYMTSAQTSTDADPIDVNCSSTRPANLHAVIPSAGGLMLFSEDQQFMMFSADGNLKPTTALIRTLSNYKMDTQIDPIDIGTHINFVSKTHSTAGFTRIFSLAPAGAGQAPQVVDIGRVVAEYVPVTIDSMMASTQNSFITMYGKTSDKAYFFRTYSDGEKDLIQTWFSWQLPGNIHYLTTDSDTLYGIIKTGSGGTARYNLVSATLTQTPEETIIVTAEGQQVNPHMDFYTAATNGLSGGSEKKVVYDSTNDFSKCYIPFEDVTTLTPVIVIAGNATSNFSGTTESGFTITPTRASDGDGTYFKVPSKDLSGQAANVYVGYKYNYDITLPKIYFRPEPNRTDYTANLTVARCKFSIGQSSVVGFKLQRKGVQAATQSFTGDGSTTAFSPDFTVKDKADVIVKKNGAKQLLTTDYTIADHATNPDQITVTFNTAPAAASTAANVTTPADSIEIYVDNWYTLSPTQEANYYLGDDVPLETQNVFTVPIHQKSDNYTLRVFSDSPFPVSLTSMAWEGNYSPRYYRRT